MEMDTARAITHRIISRTNANWIKADRTSYAPGTLLCTEAHFKVGDEQPKIRLLYCRDGWEARVVWPGRPTTRWQWCRRVYRSAMFPPHLEYTVFDRDRKDSEDEEV